MFPSRCAVPAGAVPERVVAPSVKVTVPDGVPMAGETAVTLAVKVTCWPETEVAGLATTAVAEAPRERVVVALPLETSKLESPL